MALKFLLPREEVARERMVMLLQQEARAIAQLNHENIIRIFDVSEWREGPREQQVPLLVMELRTLISRERWEAALGLAWASPPEETRALTGLLRSGILQREAPRQKVIRWLHTASACARWDGRTPGRCSTR
ncbi:MAG TPA: hypothetical protein VEU33_32010 [Archangium sp.]|nr:hypothetical protein [Archangium sp.]